VHSLVALGAELAVEGGAGLARGGGLRLGEGLATLAWGLVFFSFFLSFWEEMMGEKYVLEPF